MAQHVKNEVARLLRRQEQLLKSWAAVDPEAATEFKVNRAALEVWAKSANERYAHIRSTKEAIHAALTFEDQFMNKRELAHKIMEGGFAVDPEFGLHLLVANMNKNIQRGHFIADDEMRIGLPEWKDRAKK